jgi:ubiquinone/menaquinone biosynthesis C-methylase UbiE
MDKLVLDACCGSRMFWFDKKNPLTIFVDLREEEHILCDGRSLKIEPDIQADFTKLPFEDGSFSLVVFDPPHLKIAGKKSWLSKKYGKLPRDWETMLQKGFSECFRVLKTHGTLIFKWNETQIPTRDILALTPIKPLFGHRSGKAAKTHWVCFLKSEGDELL